MVKLVLVDEITTKAHIDIGMLSLLYDKEIYLKSFRSQLDRDAGLSLVELLKKHDNVTSSYEYNEYIAAHTNSKVMQVVIRIYKIVESDK